MPAPTAPLFFVHIPKTAGTSFRESAKKRWGERKVWSDYGNTRHSSDPVRLLIHEQRDYFAFQNAMQAKRVRMLSGHAPVRYYRRIFPAANIITFLRDPIDRTISHYYTACSRQGFNGNFEAFCNIPEHQNVQSRYLEQMPVEALGFVGLTERYSEGLEIFNKSFAQKLSVLSLNQYAGSQLSDGRAALTEEDIAKAREINHEDLALYKTASDVFDTRCRLFKQGKHYTHGKIQKLASQRLEGWAIDYNDTQPVDVEIILNGNLVTTKTAHEYSAAMKERNIGRAGYVGFVHAFSEPLGAGDCVEVRVAGSGQVLRGPVKVAVEELKNRNKQANQSSKQLQQNITPLNTPINTGVDRESHSAMTQMPMGKAAND